MQEPQTLPPIVCENTSIMKGANRYISSGGNPFQRGEVLPFEVRVVQGVRESSVRIRGSPFILDIFATFRILDLRRGEEKR